MERTISSFNNRVNALGRVGSFKPSLSSLVRFTGTYSIKTSDFPPSANEDRLIRGRQIASSAIPTLASSPRDVSTYRLLGSLGSHDLSAMRELLGSPKSCFAATRNRDDSKPFITAMLEYEGFTTIYETGIDSVRVFDASIEVMGDGKRLRLDYDTVRDVPLFLVSFHESYKRNERSVALRQGSTDNDQRSRINSRWSLRRKDDSTNLQRCLHARTRRTLRTRRERQGMQNWTKRCRSRFGDLLDDHVKFTKLRIYVHKTLKHRQRYREYCT